ncbi:alpha/beta hydrolase fold domain-containing protein [Ideonella paludis]|uniref:alpha/beta hydrolase fold domain-containing protein n=1 Tax=Ideonella paludis TaxID=1233411 RepID=UPI00363615A7
MVIFIHGGGFVAGSKEDNRGKALSYAQAGYVAATINYRLTPNNEVDAATRLRAMTQAAEDTANAVRYLKANAATYFIDTTRMATFGGSAGGALSLTNAISGMNWPAPCPTIPMSRPRWRLRCLPAPR